MNNLGKFLRSVRLRKNISELKAARRAELSLEDYVDCEYAPEKAPISKLDKMFGAIEMTDDERLVFESLYLSLTKPTLRPARPLAPARAKIELQDNVVLLQNQSGIKKVPRTKKKTTKANQRRPDLDKN